MDTMCFYIFLSFCIEMGRYIDPKVRNRVIFCLKISLLRRNIGSYFIYKKTDPKLAHKSSDQYK